MPKRKDDAATTHHVDLDALPIPIQNFLWRQLRYIGQSNRLMGHSKDQCTAQDVRNEEEEAFS